MRLLLLIVLLISIISDLPAQNQQTNLTKYWNYRQRLRDRFMVVTKAAEARGTNMPAANIDLGSNTILWDDNNGAFSHYLSVLATEYWLLKNNGEDVSQTAQELLYAMWSIERLDQKSEVIWRNGSANLGKGDINGAHLRDDVSTAFWNANSSHFVGMTGFGSVYEGDPPSNPPYEEISQDNIFHYLEGLSLVQKLVGQVQFPIDQLPTSIYGPSAIYSYLFEKYVVSPFQDIAYVDFSGWANDIAKRYVHWAQSSSIEYKWGLASTTNFWLLKNPVTGQLVREGSGGDYDLGVFYHIGLLRTVSRMTGLGNLREHDAFIVSNIKAAEIFDDLFNIGSATTINVPWPSGFPQPVIHINSLFDDYKIRTLSMNGNGNDGYTFNKLRILRDDASVFDYEHLPMMYTVINDPNNTYFPVDGWMYNEDKAIIEPLMNSAPPGGPKTNGVLAWSSDSRLVWPEKLGERSGQNIELVGLDYMLMHNLYYIAFRREDFKLLTIPTGVQSAYNTGTTSAGRIQASNTIPSGSNTNYVGRRSILLLPGFSTGSGSQFNAKIEGRPNNYNGGLYVKPAQSGSRLSGDMILKQETPEGPFGVAEDVDLHSIVRLDAPVENGSLEKDGFLRVYPNPAGSDLNVAVYKEFDDGDVKILDVQGRELFTQKLQPGIGMVDLRSLSNGVYIVKVRIGNDEVTSKMTVVK